MKLTKITPRGFCKGVVDAWVIAKDVAKKFPSKKIYIIGWLVHNKNMINEISKLGITTLDDRNESRWDLIKSIDSIDNPIVIFSAHGTDPKLIEYAKNSGLIVYDATCFYVKKVHEIILEKIKNNTIIFIGVKNHPETISVLSLNNKIILISNEQEAKDLKISQNEKIFVTNQTTISIYEFFNILKILKSKFKNIEFKNDICNAAKERQDAIINMDETIDILFVVGDKRSNNTKKLLEIAKSKNVDSYLINDKSEINFNLLDNKNHIGVTSGCSTPTWTTNDVIISLQNFMDKKNGKNNS